MSGTTIYSNQGVATDDGSVIDTNVIGGWALDIYDDNNNPLVCGIPLVTGIDLLYQYQYLGIGGALVVSTDGSPSTPPTFTDLGTTGHLYFVVTSTTPFTYYEIPTISSPQSFSITLAGINYNMTLMYHSAYAGYPSASTA